MVRKDKRVCQCKECQQFPLPEKKPRMGIYGQSVAWRSRLWCKTKAGYYRNSKAGGLLHRVIYQTHVGKIPTGADVHHRDEDPSNNSISNLVLLSRAEHTKAHGFMQGELQQYTKKCIECGNKYTTAWPSRALYCSNACKSRVWKRQHPDYRNKGSKD